MPKTIVISLGGNALSSSGKVTYDDLIKSIHYTCKLLVAFVKKKCRVIIVFGSGPQVGALLIKNELAKYKGAAMPLHVLDAEVQGELGYLLEQSLQNELQKNCIKKPVVSVLTQVIVNASDPAFQNPNKPVGPFLTRVQANKLKKQNIPVKEDAGRGWRKVVPSPLPQKIDEVYIIRKLAQDAVVIACGGGGIPVIEKQGQLQGVEAVIDKDHAASLLATSIGADELFIITSVPYVYKNYKKGNQEKIKEMSVKEARALLGEGHFLPGSMQPKIEASIEFLERGGKRVIITHPLYVKKALLGKEGTTILAQKTQ